MSAAFQVISLTIIVPAQPLHSRVNADPIKRAAIKAERAAQRTVFRAEQEREAKWAAYTQWAEQREKNGKKQSPEHIAKRVAKRRETLARPGMYILAPRQN